LTSPIEGGRFTAAVSIRSDAGSMTHDRVLRFAPVFGTHGQATSFATDQARAWLGQPALEPHRSTTTPE
jgi:hypothetical protein